MGFDKHNSCVVSGRSILSSAAKMLDTNIDNCTFLEYKTFCDFLESVILHDKLYIIGDFNDRENSAFLLMQKMNELNGEEFIISIDDSLDKFIIGGVNVDIRIKEIIENTFDNEISFIRKQLIPEHYTYRYNEDEKIYFLTRIAGICGLEPGKVFTEIKSLTVELFRKEKQSEYTKHLLRALVIAATASVLNGTAKFTGSRILLGSLILNHNSKSDFETRAFKIYKHANSLFMNFHRELVFKNQILFYQPLMLSIFLNKLESREFSIQTIIDLRNDFIVFRKTNCSRMDEPGSKRLKSEREFNNTINFYNEIYRLASDNNFKNLMQKYYKELLLDDTNIKIEYDFKDSATDTKVGPSSGINIAKIAKNIFKFSNEFLKNTKIKKLNQPLSTYLVNLINSPYISFQEKFIKINEFQEHKMKKIDLFLRKNNL